MLGCSSEPQTFTKDDVIRKNNLWCDKKTGKPITGFFDRKDIKGMYKDGKPHGNLESYTETGILFTRTSYKNGLRDGKSIVYSENGIRSILQEYKNGKKDGQFIMYNEEGTPIIIR